MEARDTLLRVDLAAKGIPFFDVIRDAFRLWPEQSDRHAEQEGRVGAEVWGQLVQVNVRLA